MTSKKLTIEELTQECFCHAGAEAYAKYSAEVQKLKENYTRKQFFYLFAICPRWFKRQPLVFNEESRERRAIVGPLRIIRGWDYGTLARLDLLLQMAKIISAEEFVESVQDLYKTADVNELILLVQSLNFLPYGEKFIERAREAARSNILSVFSAVAHNSTYARQYFDLPGWNQLILKAAFLAVPIWNIEGLAARNNVGLVEKLKHYVWERQAASRVVPWDIWCCICWLAESEDDFAYLRKQFSLIQEKGQLAMILALMENKTAPGLHLANELGKKVSTDHKEYMSWSYAAALRE